jgi:hypothetical protein
MTTQNSYVTLAEIKAQLTAPGQTFSTDAPDDSVIENILNTASRIVDEQTGRRFYPKIETRYFDIPELSRTLQLEGDLLEVITLTNGDTVVLTTTDYALYPKNFSPSFAIRLKESSSYYWAQDGNGNTEDVISVLGLWGYHNDYANAWLTGSTLAEDLDISELPWTMTSGTLFAADQIIRVENELSIIASVSTNDVTVVKRPENGSTAAIHASGTAVKIWQPMASVKRATLLIAESEYQKRFGENESGVARITAAGVVITPAGFPRLAKEIIDTLIRRS